MLADRAVAVRDLTVACVLESGGDFDVEYVERLHEGVSRHLSLAHRFVCLSDVSVPCERIALRQDWPGWWSKLELFEQFSGPTLYFDLDTVIVGSLDEIADYPHQFSMLQDFTQPSGYGSGVMGWCGDYSYLAKDFSLARISDYQRAHRWGDQGWIVDRLPRAPERLQALFAHQIHSYKHRPTNRSQERVVCFHGKPRPRDVNWSV